MSELKKRDGKLDISGWSLDSDDLLAQPKNVLQIPLGKFRPPRFLSNEQGKRRRLNSEVSASHIVDPLLEDSSSPPALVAPAKSMSVLSKLEDNPSSLSHWGLPSPLIRGYHDMGVDSLYPWQSECLSKVTADPRSLPNLVYQAPTGGGKTLVAEVIMFRNLITLGRKALFVVPFVSIVTEKERYLRSLVKRLFRVESFFGGSDRGKSMRQLLQWKIAVTTIEKANSLVNRWVADDSLTEQLGCLIIDELHMVGQAGRGYILELLLTKLRFVQKKQPERRIQIVGLSATLPNLGELAEWLNAVHYETDFRPIRLAEFMTLGNSVSDRHGTEIVRSLHPSGELATLMEKSRPLSKSPVNWTVVLLCSEVFRNQESCLVFCHSKRQCQIVCSSLARCFAEIQHGDQPESESTMDSRRQLVSKLAECEFGLDEVLARSVPVGLAFHNSSLTVEERSLIEQAFRDGIISVLCATSTLAAGVNLPASRVIFDSLRIGISELGIAQYKQMAGRAGRKGQSTKGESYAVLKHKHEIETARRLMNSELPPMQSQLSASMVGLTRILNEAVASQMVRSKDDVPDFIFCTLLSTQVIRQGQDPSQFLDQSVKAMRFLSSLGFIVWDPRDKYWCPTPLGRACFHSSLDPWTSLQVFRDLTLARKRLILADELSVVFQLSPLPCSAIPSDWASRLESFGSRATKLRGRVFDSLGLDPPFWAQLQFMIAQGKTSSMSPSKVNEHFEQRATEMKMKLPGGPLEWHDQLQISHRLFQALLLVDLLNGSSHADLTHKYNVEKGVIQRLQSEVVGFGHMVAVFAEKLNWVALRLVVGEFVDRFQLGCINKTEQKQFAKLLEIRNHTLMNRHTARTLFDNGITDLTLLAQATPEDVRRMFDSAAPFQSSEDPSSKRNKYANFRLANMLVKSAQCSVNEKIAQRKEKDARFEALKNDSSSHSMNSQSNGIEKSHSGVSNVPELTPFNDSTRCSESSSLIKRTPVTVECDKPAIEVVSFQSGERPTQFVIKSSIPLMTGTINKKGFDPGQRNFVIDEGHLVKAQDSSVVIGVSKSTDSSQDGSTLMLSKVINTRSLSPMDGEQCGLDDPFSPVSQRFVMQQINEFPDRQPVLPGDRSHCEVDTSSIYNRSDTLTRLDETEDDLFLQLEMVDEQSGRDENAIHSSNGSSKLSNNDQTSSSESITVIDEDLDDHKSMSPVDLGLLDLMDAEKTESIIWDRVVPAGLKKVQFPVPPLPVIVNVLVNEATFEDFTNKWLSVPFFVFSVWSVSENLRYQSTHSSFSDSPNNRLLHRHLSEMHRYRFGGLSITWSSQRSFVIPINHRYRITPSWIDSKVTRLWTVIERAFSNPASVKISFNTRIQSAVLRRCGINIRGPMLWDIRIANWMFEPDYSTKHQTGLDGLCRQWLSNLMVAQQSIIDQRMAKDRRECKSPFGSKKVLSPDQCPYQLSDLVFTIPPGVGAVSRIAVEIGLDNWHLMLCMNRLICWMRKSGMLRSFVCVESPLSQVLSRMETCGVGFRSWNLRRVESEMKAKLAWLKSAVDECALSTRAFRDRSTFSSSFNIQSPNHISALLFSSLGLSLPIPPVAVAKQRHRAAKKVTPSRRGRPSLTVYSTSKEVLSAIGLATHPVIGHILEYRRLSKFFKGFVEVLPRLSEYDCELRQQRIPSAFLQTATATGRLSMESPNLQCFHKELSFDCVRRFSIWEECTVLNRDVAECVGRLSTNPRHSSLEVTVALCTGEDDERRYSKGRIQSMDTSQLISMPYPTGMIGGFKSILEYWQDKGYDFDRTPDMFEVKVSLRNRLKRKSRQMYSFPADKVWRTEAIVSPNNPQSQSPDCSQSCYPFGRVEVNPRECIHARLGYLLISVDYSQIELRMLAHFACDDRLISDMQDGVDVMRRVAAMLHGKAADEVSVRERDQAKAVVYGIMYGASSSGLAMRSDGDLTSKEAARIQALFQQSYPQCADFMRRCIQQARQQRFVSTLLGRRRTVFRKRDSMATKRDERVTINTLCQGSAADLIKVAMIRFDERMRVMEQREQDSLMKIDENGSDDSEDGSLEDDSQPVFCVGERLRKMDYIARIVLNIHDELLIEVRKDSVIEVQSVLQECMEHSLRLNVPITVKTRIGEDWAHLQPFDSSEWRNQEPLQEMLDVFNED